MAIHDYVIANGSGSSVRSDLNDVLAAIVSNNSNGSEPNPAYAYQWWADTSTGYLKIRNASNNGWVTLFKLDGTIGAIIATSPSNTAPSSPITGQLWLDTSQTPDVLKVYNGAAFAGLLALAGGTMTGNLTLTGNPTTANMASNKAYVDTHLPLTGGSLTGTLNATTIGMSGQLLIKANSISGTTGYSNPSIGVQGDGDTGIVGGANNAGYVAIVSHSHVMFDLNQIAIRLNPHLTNADTHIYGSSTAPVASVSGPENVLYIGKESANNLNQGYTTRAQLDVYASSTQKIACRLENRTTDDVLSINANKGASSPGTQYIMPIRVGTSAALRGSIQWNGSNQILFNSTSDYRAKENVIDLADAIVDLKKIRPVNFNFIGNSENTLTGFIAHELQEVLPGAVGGEKDAVDADGEPILQGVDPGKVVPLLTAALQEAVTRIEALEASVAAIATEN